jgi:hypothetical protein
LNDRPLESPSSVVSHGESLSPAHLMYGHSTLQLRNRRRET